MGTSLTVRGFDNVPALPTEDVERVSDFAKQATAYNTRRGYKADFAAFQSWCASRNVSALPAAPETVAGFLASQAEVGFTTATIGRRISAISFAHRLANHETPTSANIVKITLKGIRRSIGGAPNKKAAAVSEIVLAMVGAVSPGIRGARDRALLLLGFGGAFRRSELIGLDVSDLTFEEAGLRVTIRHSKPTRSRWARQLRSRAATQLVRFRLCAIGSISPESLKARFSGQSIRLARSARRG
jgi:site-specific recombinase XerD